MYELVNLNWNFFWLTLSGWPWRKNWTCCLKSTKKYAPSGLLVLLVQSLNPLQSTTIGVVVEYLNVGHLINRLNDLNLTVSSFFNFFGCNWIWTIRIQPLDNCKGSKPNFLPSLHSFGRKRFICILDFEIVFLYCDKFCLDEKKKNKERKNKE